jgi:hypothetical protein
MDFRKTGKGMGQETEESRAQNAETLAPQPPLEGQPSQPVQPGQPPQEGKKPMRISSPEQVDDYIRVTTPGMWLLVAAILILLGAGIIWGFATKLEMKKVDQKGQVTTEYVTPASFVTDGIAGN